MRAARGVLTLAGIAMLALSACGGNDRAPQLMNLRSPNDGPDEFAILPAKPLELPVDLAALPDPTPGGSNLTDRNPEDDAIIALGGKPGGAGGIPAADGGLASYAGRHGVSAGIRATLASEDLAFRKRNNGRLLERLFDLNVYYRAYEGQSLDQHAELDRWRRAGARTPSAPPRKDGE